VSSGRSVNSLFYHAVEILSDFECGSKLIAQLMMVLLVWHHNMQEHKQKFRERYPNAIFDLCYAHKLNLVLVKSASFIKEVKVFFASLSLWF
jgi:hypothetical protein